VRLETQPTAADLLAQAASRVRQALDTWQATDLVQVAEAQLLLVNAVADLRKATALISLNPAEKAAELRKLAAGLRRDLNRLARVVDACSAFQNGIAIRLGISGVVYQPSGAAASPAAALSQGIEA
jgi:hypothetical protein